MTRQYRDVLWDKHRCSLSFLCWVVRRVPVENFLEKLPDGQTPSLGINVGHDLRCGASLDVLGMTRAHEFINADETIANAPTTYPLNSY